VTGPPADADDAKLVTLARAARQRAAARQGAAVRDIDGRTYSAADVSLPTLRLSALQVAVAMAVSSGARQLEAALVLGDDSTDDVGVAAVRDLSPDAIVRFADSAGRLSS
jgi:trehalose-6-phosphatase